ncbi:Spc24 subunit of Ndc80-domain-containing protein [Powellomyces hirtus]|nr:Spc24 subunit of Ndc80-domain-containing protein [Powellomyces hirtus]
MLSTTLSMSKDFKDPLEMADHLLEGMNAAQDAALIRSITDLAQRTEDVRAEVVDDARATLKALARQLQVAKEAANNPKRQVDVNQHAERMIALDREKYTVAKEMADMEDSIESLESQLDQLDREMRELEREEEVEAQLPPTKEQLTLSIFHGLGIEMQKDENGNYVRCKVRRYASQDIHIQDFADKYSRYFYANLLWDACI